jgi:hypothetical protein
MGELRLGELDRVLAGLIREGLAVFHRKELEMRIASRVFLLLLLSAFALSSALRADSKDPASSPQAKAYAALLKAVQAGDFEAYKKCMTKESAKKIDQQIKNTGMDPKKGMEFLKAMAPTDLKYTSLKVDQKKATLQATGKVGGEGNNKGTIELEQEDGQWKVANQSWTNAK